MQGRRKRGGWGALAPPPGFAPTINPISTRGADYTHQSTTSPPGFSDLATGLYSILMCMYQNQCNLRLPEYKEGSTNIIENVSEYMKKPM